MTDAGAPTIVPWGDAAVLVRFGARIDPVLNARALALAAAVRRSAPPWLFDCVPGYAAVLVQFDPLAAEPAAVERLVRERLRAADDAPSTPSTAIEIPVCYAPEHAPDLADVAAARGISVDDVIRRHAGRAYRVYMLGFRPGFAFLGPVDDAIAVPRLPTPRTHVPAGAVGIAGQQTGIYPNDGPGGWRLIGRTPRRLFDPAAPAPFLLAAGDTVRFVPVDAATFARLQETPDAR